jgi:LuxR family maltose regulon positive regulatory protein
MSTPILATKLYIPPPRPKVVHRPRLIERLNGGLQHKLMLISAPAGFGKTTLLSEWAAGCGQPAAWLSLDEGDNDPARFLAYFVAALQAIAPDVGVWLMAALQSPQPPSAESLLTNLLNEITAIPDDFVLVLDDYHVVEAKAVDQALTFLLEHLPPQMRLVIATREDPDLPLARWRGRGQLTEVRAADLRFTHVEAAGFLNQVMGLNLTAGDVAALETRTEGWIAGLQLAALSMQGHQDTAGFIKSFTGSHHFVMDYLVEEVLQQQPGGVQTFLLYTSILNRLCGPLCDAVLLDPAAGGQVTLEYLERANLFITPLDNERCWYRYHHLFADLLRQRLHQNNPKSLVDELHVRASQWYEDSDLDIEAFQHATAANDIDRAERLMDGRGIPLHLRGAVTMMTEWFESLPTAVKNARPSLWWRQAAMLLVIGQTTGVEEKLDAAEAALEETEANNRPLLGRIAVARAVLALTRYQAEMMLAQSRRALAYLPAANLSLRANANWTMGVAYLYQGERAAARQAFMEAIALSQTAGDVFITILATIGLGNVTEADSQLRLAAETYRRVLQWAGDQPLQIIYEAHLGLARILYEWNDLDAAEQHGQQSLHLARQYDQVIDRFIVCELFLARVKLAQGDTAGAAALIVQADQSARQRNFFHRFAEVAAAQVEMLLHQGQVEAAERLAKAHNLPPSLARVYLANGDPAAALTVLKPWRQQIEAKNWQDERLKVMVLQGVALDANGEPDKAAQLLGEVLASAEPEGFIRLFVDEGRPMEQLLERMKAEGGRMKEYIHRLLAAFDKEEKIHPSSFVPQPLLEPLSQRELEVLQLIAQGLSNQAISERLFLALDTVKGHNRRIFDKLEVQRRTEAVARARELGLLSG